MIWLKSIRTSIAKHVQTKAVQAAWTMVVWLSAPLAAAVVAWMRAPVLMRIELSRRQLVLAVAAVGLLITASVWITRWWLMGRKKLPPIDALQKDVLRLLWAHRDNCWSFEPLQQLLDESPSSVRLACQRLQQRGLIAFLASNPNSLVQLLDEGREFAAAHSLTNPNSILKAAVNRAQELDVPERSKVAVAAAPLMKNVISIKDT